MHEVLLLTDGVKNLGLDVPTEVILGDGEADEHDSSSERVPPSLSVEDEDWDDLKPDASTRG